MGEKKEEVNKGEHEPWNEVSLIIKDKKSTNKRKNPPYLIRNHCKMKRGSLNEKQKHKEDKKRYYTYFF